MRARVLLAIVVVLASACREEERPSATPTPAPEAAVDTPPPPGGAVVRGRVVLDGPRPAPRLRPVTFAREACGADPKADRSLVVGSDGEVAWAVVTLVQATDGAPAPAPRRTIVDHARCDLYPYVTVVPPGSTVRIENSDSALHGVRRADSSDALALRPDGEVSLVFPAEEKVKLVCDLHYWTAAWVVVTPAPFHAVTDVSGSFELRGVPAGRWRLIAWHERFGEVERELDLAEGARVSETLTLPSLAPTPAPTP